MMNKYKSKTGKVEREMKLTLADLIPIGDDIVNSIGKNRLMNDQVLYGKVKVYQKIKRTLNNISGSKIDIMEKVANSIREIEKHLDIISPN